MNIKEIEFEAKWTPDCGGKWDLDFGIISVSTRYWDDCTARPTIFIGNKILYELPKGEYICGRTEEECKTKTEQWIKEKIEIIIEKLN